MTSLASSRPSVRPLVVGHQGAAGLAAANTLPSIAAALRLGVDMVELDVRATVDHQLVLFHDEEIRTPGGRLPLRACTAATVRRLVPAPTLDEALAVVDRGAGLLLDVKVRGHEEALVAALRRHRVVDTTLVCSTDWLTLAIVRCLEPRLAVSFSYPADRPSITRRRYLLPLARAALVPMRWTIPYRIASLARQAGALATTLFYPLVTPHLVERVHRAGLQLFAWTVDEPAHMERLASLGVDGIITNRPDVALAVRSSTLGAGA